ncbi:MAG TPA: amidohydrolase family protein [Bryobacteraceae bacterium]|nr:amidohydrolase family protein [Bryobacteraceae bacterium]
MILTNARILTFDGANRVLNHGSVEIASNGTIASVSTKKADGVDLGGRLLMPALINCHSHLYGTLARGISLPGPAPRNFPQILKKLWWRLDRALTPEDVYYSALVGLIDSAKNGVGTVIDHHSSPSACTGSLDLIEKAFQDVGLRGATCYETSDRNGRKSTGEAIRENVRFIEARRTDSLVQAAFGLHAAFTLSDHTLQACREACDSFHVHVAEDRCDRGAVRRLAKLGILNERTIAAHCVHVTAAERKLLSSTGANVVHNPQSNCNNAVGAARLPELFHDKVLVGLGSDGYSPRLWDEFKTALHIQKDPKAVFAAAFLNNRTILKKIWGFDVGRIERGANADLLVLDYFPPTPIDSSNLLGHALFGLSNAPVDSLLVNGQWVVLDKHCVSIDERQIAEKAAACARKLWERI